MSDVPAFRSRDIPALTAAPAIAARRASSNIAVEVADAAQLAEMRAAWTDLVVRAETPNVFMDPALVCAAAAADPDSEYRPVLAWKPVQGQRTLVGVWAFALGRAPRSLPVRMLT